MSFGAGAAIEVLPNLSLNPAVGLESTFSEGPLALSESWLYVTLPIIWFTPSGFWIGYAPTIRREREPHDCLDDHSITVGKMFENGVGFSIVYGNVDRVGPVSIPDDAQLVLNLHYQFGSQGGQ